jgi:subtilisin family serine protease
LKRIVLLAALAALSTAAPAGAGLRERQELKALAAQGAAAASHSLVPLPLGSAGVPAATAARHATGELGAIARADGPVRLIVGARTHAALGPLTTLLRRLGARPRPIATVAAVAATAPDPGRLAAALRRDRRVAYVERDRPLALAADGDVGDSGHGGIPFSWALQTVRSPAALAAAGGGSARTVAILDTGVDLAHPDLAGRLAQPFDTASRTSDVTDRVGHGTFVAGLVSALDGNGLGSRGAGGATRSIPIRGSTTGDFTLADVIVGVDYALRSGADILNLSLAGDAFSLTQARALEVAFLNDVLPVAASGNRAQDGNPIEYPGALVGGVRGAPGIGLSVGATLPGDQPAGFSNHNPFVSLAAPGASEDCKRGVFSTVPRNANDIWDAPPGPCDPPLSYEGGGGRWGYGQGTSFATPLASGIAALVWQVEPELQSEQVAHVMIRSARQTVGAAGTWNEFTGRGVVDGGAATALARVYDTDPPRIRARARRVGPARAVIRIRRSADTTDPGHELAGGVAYTAAVSTNGGASFKRLKRAGRPFRKKVKLRGRKRHLLVAVGCDANGNCRIKRLGGFKRRRG